MNYAGSVAGDLAIQGDSELLGLRLDLIRWPGSIVAKVQDRRSYADVCSISNHGFDAT